MTKTWIKSTGKNHLCKRIFIRRDEISGEESSLEDIFNPSGMKSVGKNHLWERIFIRRDEISWEESSLGEDFYPQR